LIDHILKPAQWEPGVDVLLNCLNPWLQKYWQSCLLAADTEPYYLPRSDVHSLHQIQFAHGYFNSALHELAHWCVAGDARRLLPDFGYWYEPDGRSPEQQELFEKVEVKPQAIEWHFAQACGRNFKVSTDNLAGIETDARPFKLDVSWQAKRYFEDGLPSRASDIVRLLSEMFKTDSGCFEFDVALLGS